MEQLFERALVAGAGVGGLAAAAALSPFAGQVTILEKDTLANDHAPRKGVAQGNHAHAFLVGGLQSLDALFPGITADLEAAGAVPVELGEDFTMFDYGMERPKRRLGLYMHCLSRPAYEQVLRARVAALGNVAIETGVRIEGVAFEAGTAIAFETTDGPRPADFLVDATGRGASLAALLEQEGFGRVPKVEIGIAMCYASGWFRLSEPWRGGGMAALCVPMAPDKRFGILLPIDDERCIVSLGGRCGVEPGAELDGFLDYARQLACPAISERLAGAELVGEIKRFRKPSSDWHRYELLELFPGRLAPVGDTIASFNPTFGQGMTIAVRHALALREALAETGGEAPAFANAYLPRAALASEEAWNGAASVDLRYPEVSGTRPPGFEQMQGFLRGLRALSDLDPEVHRLEIEVFQMARPASTFADPGLHNRVAALLGG
jgi:2-polyprenyl-6-methoxyphenol hydroxylase-like FAD-dependent oxidoreductase